MENSLGMSQGLLKYGGLIKAGIQPTVPYSSSTGTQYSQLYSSNSLLYHTLPVQVHNTHNYTLLTAYCTILFQYRYTILTTILF
jgi:hypothetical protein